MEDLFYPNNRKREERISELAADIGRLGHELSKDADEIKRLLELLDAKIRKMYGDIQVPIPSSYTHKFHFHGWVTEVFALLEPLILFGPAEKALQAAAVFALRKAGRIAEAVFYSAAELGLDLLTGIKFGVEAGSVVCVIALDFAIAGIAGDVKKHKLRKSLHSAIKPRIKMKKAAMINERLREKLVTVSDTCDTMIQLGYTKDQLDKAQEAISDEFKKEAAEVTLETAKHALAELDKQRGSWTHEDHK